MQKKLQEKKIICDDCGMTAPSTDKEKECEGCKPKALGEIKPHRWDVPHTLPKGVEGESHETERNYCCACEYDIAVMEDKIECVRQSTIAEIKEIAKDMRPILWNDDPNRYLENVAIHNFVANFISRLEALSTPSS